MVLGCVVVDFVDWDGGMDYVRLDCFCFWEGRWLAWCIFLCASVDGEMGDVTGGGGGRKERDGWV